MFEVRDFTKKGKFPGVRGNLFDIVLNKAMLLENIPNLIFLFILASLTLFGYPQNGFFTFTMLAFFVFDWVSIALLPVYKRSFGPIKPQVLALAFLRMLPVIFTPPIVWVPLEFLGCFLQVYAFWVEPYQIKISKQDYFTPKIMSDVKFKILHIGDLHLERMSIRERELNKVIINLKPDIILFSGDYLSLSFLNDKDSWEDLRRVISQWAAPLGIFGVTGSPAVDLPDNFPELVQDTPLRLLVDEKILLRKEETEITVIGLSCTHQPHRDMPRLENLMQNDDPTFQILLHHSPDIAPQIPAKSIDLHLAGHTHGGQVCLPFFGPIFTGSLYGLVFKSGRYRIKDFVLYITRGLGLEGLSAPRVRFLCPPEVVLWEISGIEKRRISK